MSRQNTDPWVTCDLEAAGVTYDRRAQRCKRKQGRVEYKAIGAIADHSLRPHYNFSTYRVVLQRLNHFTKSRPEGSTTTVTIYDYDHNFEAVP